MKTEILQSVMTLLVLLFSLNVHAYDAEVDGNPLDISEGTDTKPDWIKPDYMMYECITTLQVLLGDTLVNFQSDDDLMCAVINNEVRAITTPQKTAGETYYLLSIVSNSSEGKVTLKYYCAQLHRIYTITDWADLDSIAGSTIYRPKFAEQTTTSASSETDAIEDIKADAATSVKKVLRKGRVVIIKNGKEYNPDGTQIK